MVTEFTVFGSCTCRDLFYSEVNKDYKKYFSIGKTGIRLSFISIMQEPIKISDELIKLYPETKRNINFATWIWNDLTKVFLKDLKENKFEYILIDTYYDVNFGIVEIDNNQFITNNLKLNKTDFFKSLKHKRFLKIDKQPQEYFELWKKNCDLFFKYLDENCPDLKVILNPARHVSQILKEDWSVEDVESFKKEAKLYNPYRDLLDRYILENFDVDVLEFDENTLAYEKSPWGVSSLHYEPQYFEDMTYQLNDIIKRNQLLSENPSINQQIRKDKRERLLNKIKLNDEIRINNQIEQKLSEKNMSLIYSNEPISKVTIKNNETQQEKIKKSIKKFRNHIKS